MAPQPVIVGFPPEAATHSHAARTAIWCATGVVFAVALDALGHSWSAFGIRVHWLELAALGCLAAAATMPGARRDWRAWATPIDGQVLSGVIISAAQLIPGSAAEHPAFPLRQVLACAGIFYGLAAQLRRSAEAVDRLWDVFAFAGVLVCANALFAGTSGLDSLRGSSAAADQGWGAHAGFFKSLAFLTVLFVARALEARSSRGWNVLALLSSLTLFVLGAAAGTGLGSAALALLDDPLHFSSVVVLLLVLSGLLRCAWDLRRARSEQAARWRGAGAAVLVLGAIAVFGGASGGEPLRALGTMLAALLVSAPEAGVTAAGPEGEGRVEVPAEPQVYGKAA